MTKLLTISRGEQPQKNEPHHYKACGVEGIYLENGFTVTKDEGYGPGVIIEDADSLHKLIGLQIVISRPHLNYRDVKFLRGQMDKTQIDLANEIGVSVQMIARYEKAEHTDVTGPADRLLRVLYVTHLFPDRQTEIMNVIIGLYQEAESGVENLVFSRAKMHWEKLDCSKAVSGC